MSNDGNSTYVGDGPSALSDSLKTNVVQVEIFGKSSKSKFSSKTGDKENAAPG